MHTSSYYTDRANQLEKRNASVNARLIAKLRRQARNAAKKEQGDNNER